MEIKGKDTSVNLDAYLNKIVDKKGVAPKARPNAQGVRSEDNVHISARARELMEAQHAAKAIPDVREDKVAEVKHRIETGTYKVDGKQIAVNMIHESLENEIASKIKTKA
jgi:negative regulator of flagellin synthesis FlgM